MRIAIAYVSLILIWGVTPLTINWSVASVGYLAGLSMRMFLAAILGVLLVKLIGHRMSFNIKALQVYTVAAVSFFAAMLLVYWASERIPSGLVSVLFGLTPLVTGVAAYFFLDEDSFSPLKIIGMFSGLFGLVWIFRTELNVDGNSYGVIAMCGSVLLHSISAVVIKRIAYDVPPISLTVGGLVVSVPLFLLAWIVSGEPLPETISVRAGGAIVFLAVFGSLLGFMLFYFVLKHLTAGSTALIPFVTPIVALTLGSLLNGETITVDMMIGTVLILSGLLLYEWYTIRQLWGNR